MLIKTLNDALRAVTTERKPQFGRDGMQVAEGAPGRNKKALFCK